MGDALWCISETWKQEPARWTSTHGARGAGDAGAAAAGAEEGGAEGGEAGAGAISDVTSADQ